MAKTLNSRIQELEIEIQALKRKLDYVSSRTEEIRPQPTTKVGQAEFKQGVMPSSGTGLGKVWTYPGGIIWNDSEGLAPPFGSDISPSKGFNKHSHSRYSGGALIKDMLEIVDYDLSNYSTKLHSQSHWKTEPPIKKVFSSKGQTVEKLGKLDLVFDPDVVMWGTVAYEVDVRKCSFVLRGTNGEINKDKYGAEMSAPLYQDDPTKTSIVWDADGGCWRIYAVFAPDRSQV
jgi:hypothetical protein